MRLGALALTLGLLGPAMPVGVSAEEAVIPEAPAEDSSPEPPASFPLPAPLPAILDAPEPAYPQEALEAKVEGLAVIAFQLDVEGIVIAARVVRDPGAGLGESARKATEESVFLVESEGELAPELRRYFRAVRFVLPEDYRPKPQETSDEEPPEPPEMADELTQLPQARQAVTSPYPTGALEAGIEGQVAAELEVSDAGEVEAVHFVSAQPAGWGFELAAVEALWQLEFTPAYAGEVPVPVRITYSYSFTLEEQITELEQDAPEEGQAIDPEGPENFSGVVRERGSRKPLAGVDVLIENLGHSTLTDEFGAFAFRGIPVGLHRVLVAAPGYAKFETEEEVRPREATDVVYFVRESPLGVPETIVRGQREKKEVARRSIRIETIERIPGTFGDPVKVVQNLPGVARSPFDFGLLIVRGSGPEDSGPHVDGIRVPQLFHFGGLRSIVTPILLDSVDFYPGGYGAAYGRLTGGILDVRTRTRYEDTIHGLLQADLLDASAAIVGPIKKKGRRHPIGGFVVAARRSYLDIVLPALVPSSVDLSRTIFPTWNDIQGKVSLDLGKGHGFSLLAYYSQDRAAARTEDPGQATLESSQGDFFFLNDFWRASLEWRYRKGPKFSNTIGFAVGQDFQHYGIGEFATIDAEIFWWILRQEAVLSVDTWLDLALGTDIIASLYAFEFQFNDFDVRTFGDDPNAEREVLNLSDSDFGFAPGVFAEARVRLVDERIRLTPGLRFDYYTVPGQFNFLTLDPRFSFRISPDPGKKLDFKGSLGIYHQNPQGYEVLEVTGNTELSPEESYQVSVGTEVQFTDWLSLDVQGFYKRLEKLVVFRSGSVVGGGSDAAWVNQGDGHIWGGELFLRWDAFKNFEGWISLTLQRSQRRDAEDKDFYWYNFDQPVIFDVVASYNLPFGFRIGGRWRYVSGNPSTPLVNSIYDADADSYLPLQGAKNSDRLPDFHALDLRIDKDFHFRRWTLTAYLDLMNVYNRQNVEQTVYNFDYTEKSFLYGLPILPNIGFKAQF